MAGAAEIVVNNTIILKRASVCSFTSIIQYCIYSGNANTPQDCLKGLHGSGQSIVNAGCNM